MQIGSQLGPYEIIAKLGDGGMGAVYRARDTRLNRDVALKVLLPEVAGDRERLARFRREAQVLASLNHPHIGSIHGLEEFNGTIALVLELVDGPTLADRVARGPLPLGEVLSIAKQIAEALEAAHEQGIIHRDLKPANIKVRADGTVKVLDFGLAKAIEQVGDGGPAGGRDPSASPTVALRAQTTEMGVILGTAAYMSPEQARGNPVDKRTDLWSFGVVLYEMLTGKRAFGGGTVSDTLAVVLRDAPDWAALPSDTPVSIRKLLRRCLEKDRRQRLPDAADIRLEIDDERAGAVAAGSPARQRVRVLPILLALSGGAIAAALATWQVARSASPASARVTRFTITPPPAMPLSSRGVALAPDGSFLVYSAGEGQLIVRRIDQLDASPLQGVTNATSPLVSPDGRWIAFVENASTLKKVAVGGGVPIVLAQLPGALRGMTWVDDETLIVATNTPTIGLLRVPADGGDPVALTTPNRAAGEAGHVFPSALPGGREVLFTIAAAQPPDEMIALLDLASGVYKPLLRGGSDARYVASGHLAFVTGGGLSAVPFDLPRHAVAGDPVQVVDRVALALGGAANVAVARDGTLVYAPAGMGGVALRSLVWVDRHGNETPISAPPHSYSSPRLSPDGSRIAVDSIDNDGDEIWIWDLTRQTLSRLTFDPASDLAPVWMPDGRRVVFASTRGGAFSLYARAADGSGADVRLTMGANAQVPTSVTADGSIVGYEIRGVTGRDLVRFSLDARTDAAVAPPLRVETLVATRFAEFNGEVSPDGRYLAYQSNESGRAEIYVRTFPSVASGRWQVSTGGGTRPAWTRGGRELVYLDGAGAMTAVPIDTSGATFRAGTPAVLFPTVYEVPNVIRSFDVSEDGERFLMIKDIAAAPGTAPGFVVVQNWLEELKRLVPVK